MDSNDDINDWGNQRYQPTKPKTDVEKLREQIIETTDIMAHNFDKVMERGEDIHGLHNRSEEITTGVIILVNLGHSKNIFSF